MDKNYIFIPGWASSKKNFSIPFIQTRLKNATILNWETLLDDEACKKIIIQDNTVICGWSLGGLLAIKLASLFKKKTRALILISSCSKMNADKSLDTMINMIEKNTRGVLKHFSHQCFSPKKSAAEELLFFKNSLSIHPNHLKRGLQFLKKTDVTSNLQALSIPTLIIHGKKDAVIPYTSAEEMHKNIRGSKLIMEKDCGHSLILTEKEYVHAHIKEFLSAV